MENKITETVTPAPIPTEVMTEVALTYLREMKKLFKPTTKVNLIVEGETSEGDIAIHESSLDSLILLIGRLRTSGKMQDLHPAPKS